MKIANRSGPFQLMKDEVLSGTELTPSSVIDCSCFDRLTIYLSYVQAEDSNKSISRPAMQWKADDGDGALQTIVVPASSSVADQIAVELKPEFMRFPVGTADYVYTIDVSNFFGLKFYFCEIGDLTHPGTISVRYSLARCSCY